MPGFSPCCLIELIHTRGKLLSSVIYSIYYSRYSTPYLSGEGEDGGLVVVVVVVREQEMLLLDAIERQVYILLGKCYHHSYTA